MGRDSSADEAGDDGLSEERAGELLHEAVMNLDRVRNDYPALTGELETLLWDARSSLALVYFRVGREEDSPSLTELAERDTASRAANGCQECEEGAALPGISRCRVCVNDGLPEGLELPDDAREKAERRGL